MGDEAPIEVQKDVLDRISIRDVTNDEMILMFNALLTAGRKQIGIKKIQQYKSSIFKFVVSVKQLFTDEKLQPTVLDSFETPINACGNLLVQLLTTKKEHPKAVEGGTKPALLSAHCGDMWSKLLDIVQSQLEAKDVEKANEAVKYFTSTEFITLFLNDKDLKSEKQVMVKHARRLKEKLIPPCKRRRCRAPRVLAQGSFGGSPFCARHHQERIAALYEPPSFPEFVRGKTLEFLNFPEYYVKEQKQDANLMMAYIRFGDFREIEHEVQRKEVSKILWDKYIAEGGEKHFEWPLEKKEEVTKELAIIREVIDSGLAGLKRGLYAKLEEILEEHLLLYFKEFTSSKLYIEKLASFHLPEEIIKKLEAKKHEEQEEQEEQEEEISDEDLDHSEHGIDHTDASPIERSITKKKKKVQFRNTQQISVIPDDKPELPEVKDVQVQDRAKVFLDLAAQQKQLLVKEKEEKEKLRLNKEESQKKTIRRSSLQDFDLSPDKDLGSPILSPILEGQQFPDKEKPEDTSKAMPPLESVSSSTTSNTNTTDTTDDLPSAPTPAEKTEQQTNTHESGKSPPSTTATSTEPSASTS